MNKILGMWLIWGNTNRPRWDPSAPHSSREAHLPPLPSKNVTLCFHHIITLWPSTCLSGGRKSLSTEWFYIKTTFAWPAFLPIPRLELVLDESERLLKGFDLRPRTVGMMFDLQSWLSEALPWTEQHGGKWGAGGNEAHGRARRIILLSAHREEEPRNTLTSRWALNCLKDLDRSRLLRGYQIHTKPRPKNEKIGLTF